MKYHEPEDLLDSNNLKQRVIVGYLFKEKAKRLHFFSVAVFYSFPKINMT